MNHCGTLRKRNGESAVAMSEERDNVTPSDKKTPQQRPIQSGLSPTVEKMFGALVDGADEAKEDYFAELEAKRASQLSSP